MGGGWLTFDMLCGGCGWLGGWVVGGCWSLMCFFALGLQLHLQALHLLLLLVLAFKLNIPAPLVLKVFALKTFCIFFPIVSLFIYFFFWWHFGGKIRWKFPHGNFVFKHGQVFIIFLTSVAPFWGRVLFNNLGIRSLAKCGD